MSAAAGTRHGTTTDREQQQNCVFARRFEVWGLSVEPGSLRSGVGLPSPRWSRGEALSWHPPQPGCCEPSHALAPAQPRCGRRGSCGECAEIQLLAAGDPAHAGAVPDVAGWLMQVVRNLPRFGKKKKKKSGELDCGSCSIVEIKNDPGSGHDCTNRGQRRFI